MKNTLRPSVSVIIPTLNAEKEISNLIDMLLIQRYPIAEIIIVDSNSDDCTQQIVKRYGKVSLISINRKEFDHGKTRDMAFRKANGDIVIFMTQDAIPANEKLIENLITPFSDEKIAISFGRQLPKPDASSIEKLVRFFNYPATDFIRCKEDVPSLGIKTFFCSDVCAAYRYDIYIKLGGFEYPLKSNEDMFFAAKAINAGYKVAYIAEAQVLHSHHFTLKEQYQRNFIQGYEIEKHKNLLKNVTLHNEGIKLVKYVSKGLLKQGNIVAIIIFFCDCLARYLGNYAGKNAFKRAK